MSDQPTKKGITIIRRMLKIDRRDEEDKWFRKPMSCQVFIGKDSHQKLLRQIWGDRYELAGHRPEAE